LLTQHQTDLSNVYCVSCDSRFTTLSGFYGHHKIKHVLVLPEQAAATPAVAAAAASPLPNVNVKLESEEHSDL
jgi:thiamine pyrophosphate-dependent acetolactate synthase large subunit-like protein